MLKWLVGRRWANAVFDFMKRTRLAYCLYSCFVAGAVTAIWTLSQPNKADQSFGATLSVCLTLPIFIQGIFFMQTHLLGFLLLDQFAPWYMVYLNTSMIGSICVAFDFDVRAVMMVVSGWLSFNLLIFTDAVRELLLLFVFSFLFSSHFLICA